MQFTSSPRTHVRRRSSPRALLPARLALVNGTRGQRPLPRTLTAPRRRAGAFDAVVSNHWEKGGAGAVALATAVEGACAEPSDFKFLYPLDLTVKEKIEAIAREMYRADGVDYTPEAEVAIAQYTRMGFDNLPICMAKTQYSFSHDAALKGAPTGFRLPIRCAPLAARR